MRIAIIGAGNVGQSLAGSFVRSGHAVTIASRDAVDAADAAARTGASSAPSARAAAASADVVVLAVPFAASGESVAREIAEAVAGRIVVDATNPLNATFDGLVTEGGPSAAERFAGWMPKARVVKAFNTVFAANQAEPVRDGVAQDGLVAGDDAEAKAVVLELERSIGFRPIDAGPLRRARELEALAWLNIALQGSLGNSWRTGWRLVGVPEEPLSALEPEPVAAG